MDFLPFGISFFLAFFTIAWVANWTIQIRKELQNRPIRPWRLLKVAVTLTAPWALLLCGVLLWRLGSANLPQIVIGTVAAPVVLFALYKIDLGKKKHASKSINNDPGNVA
jgi:hypothetical protein